MGGRGRSNTSFTQEQLHAFGVVSKDTLAGPPPLFPPLISKPVKLKSTPDIDYKILWNEEFMLSMRDSPYYISKDSHQEQSVRGKPKFVYSHMPAELRPNYVKKNKAPESASEKSSAKKPKIVDLDTRLKVLEQKEMMKIKEEPDGVKKEPESDQEDQLEEDQFDTEMDEENDYGNNYFDNGESFNDEDDNLDDGPTY